MQTELKFISSVHYNSVIVSGGIIFFTFTALNFGGLISDTAGLLLAFTLFIPAVAGVITGELIKTKGGNNHLIEVLIPLLGFLLLDYLYYLIRGAEPGMITKINNDFLRAGISFRMNNLLAGAMVIIFLRLNYSDLKDYILRVSMMITLLLVINYSGITYFYTLLSSLAILLTARALIMAEQNSNQAAGYIMIVLTALFLSTTTTGVILSLFHSLHAWRSDLKRLTLSLVTTAAGVVMLGATLLTDTLGIISALNIFVVIAAAIAIIYLGWITVTPEEVYFYSGITALILASYSYVISDAGSEVYILALTSALPLLVSSAGYYITDRYLGRVLT